MHLRRLAGLDIGSTTTRAVFVEASLAPGASGRLEVVSTHELAPATSRFTPWTGACLDLAALLACLPGGPAPEGGAVLLTGLAAAAPNAIEVATALRARIGDAVAVTAHDPGLEAWLAFQAAARSRSLAEPERWFVNLDIGGGTTSLAAGRGGEVERVGSLRVGARHVRLCADGTVLGTSPVGDAALAHLGLPRTRLSESAREALAGLAVVCLEAAVAGRAPPLDGLVELPFVPPDGDVVYTLSGGVGALVYAPDLPAETFDDLGVRIARRLRASPLGRAPGTSRAAAATVLGLALASTEHAGATVFAPALPGDDLPIRARLRADDPLDALALGGAFQLVGCPIGLAGVRALAARVSAAITERPVVLLVDTDSAQALGSLVTGWGARPRALVVLDGLPPRPARVLRLRRGVAGGVEVRYFGFV
jgi:ethanolamine utilization protein EutA